MFTIYSKPNCPNCVSAKKLLESKELPFQVLELDMGQPKDESASYFTVQELKARVPSATSVPQIFARSNGTDVHIGGFFELRKFLQS